MKTAGVNLDRVLRVRERMEANGSRAARVERNPIDHEGVGGSHVCRHIYDVYIGDTWVGARWDEDAARHLARAINEKRSRSSTMPARPMVFPLDHPMSRETGMELLPVLKDPSFYVYTPSPNAR